MSNDDLLRRLEHFDTDVDVEGVTCCRVFRNPDGPEAAARIRALEAQLAEARALSDKARIENAAARKRQADTINVLTKWREEAKAKIAMMKRQRRAETANETRDIDQLIACNLKIERQREEIARLRERDGKLAQMTVERDTAFNDGLEEAAKVVIHHHEPERPEEIRSGLAAVQQRLIAAIRAKRRV